MRRGRSTLALAGFGTVTLLALTGCIDDAGTGASSATTLAPLVQSSFVTLPPATTTTIVAPVTTPVVTNTTTAGSPGAATTTTAAGSDDDTDSTSGGATGGGGGSYTVQSGDTVFGIARTHGVSAQALADANGWSDGTSHPIFPGDTIELPAGASATATTAGSSSSGATTTTSATSTSAGGGSSGGTYTVVAGDYLAGIAAKVGTTVQAIVTANGWSDGADHPIYPGDVIKLPAKSG
jgi:LysM repeat protein